MRTLNTYTEEQFAEARSIVDTHNASIGEVSENSPFYVIDVTGRKSVYFTLYRFSPLALKNPYSYCGNLSTNLIEAVKKICTGTGLKVELSEQDNFNPEFPKSGVINFGKHKGKILPEIYEEAPGYVLWIANKFEPRTKHMSDIVQHAKHIAEMHWQMLTEKNQAECTSQYVGEMKERLELPLTITFKKEQTGWMNDTYFKYKAKDANDNIFQFTSKKSFEPEVLTTFKGTVKGHKEIVGRRTTLLNRVVIEAT